mgnify:CR=1 FL=1
MKKKIVLIIALLCTILNVNALSYVKEEDNLCTETESYKKWKSLSEKERKNTIMPVKCKEFYTANIKTTETAGNSFNVDYKTQRKFSLLNYNKVSPVYDQGNSNMCWTFATTSVIESSMLIEQNKQINLSERHIDFNSISTLDDGTKNPFGYYSKTKDTGGNFYQVGAYLASGHGPIIETKLPWNTTTSNKSNTLNQTNDYYINEIDYIASDSCDADTILAIKKNLTEYGAMGAVIYAEYPTYVSNDKLAYYYDGTNSINHAITIVGWDDDYSASNFKKAPKGNGAWLTKDTYPNLFGGTTEVPAGYHYVSYYDTNICSSLMSAYKIETPSYNNSYSNNIHSFSGDIVVNVPTVYFKNIYTKQTSKAEKLTKINIFTGFVGDKYELYYSEEDDFNKATKVAEGTATKFGYTAVDINKDINISKQKFYIYLKYTTTYKETYNGETSYIFPQEIFASSKSDEDKWYYVENKPTGVSYYSDNTTSWIDTTSNSDLQFYPVISVFTSNTTEGFNIKNTQKSSEDLNVEEGGSVSIYLNLSNITMDDLTLKITNNGKDVTDLFNITKGTDNFKITLTDKTTAGTFDVTISSSNASVKTSFTVSANKNILVTNIKIIGKDEISVAGTLNLTTEVTPTNATNKEVYWSVNNTRLASINQSGILTGLKEGEVTITASSKDGSNIKATKTIKIIDINKEEGNGETIVNPPANETNQSTTDTENPQTGISNLTAVLLSCLFISTTLFIISKKHNVFKKF